jgi:hypothetical protein
MTMDEQYTVFLIGGAPDGDEQAVFTTKKYRRPNSQELTRDRH